MIKKKFEFSAVRMIIVLVIATLVCNILFPLANVSAKDASNLNTNDIYQSSTVKNSFKQMNSLASKSTEVTDIRKIESIKDLSKDVISKQELKLNSQTKEMNFEDAKVIEINDKDTRYTSIVIPLIGERYSFISNITLAFDINNKLVSYSEALITKNSNNKFVISNYIDGVLVKKDISEIDYVNNKELKKGLENMKKSVDDGQKRGVGAVAGCIAAVAGVNGVVAYLIAGTCIASCPAVVPICVACISGVAALGAADVGAIVACFNLL